MRMKRLRTRPIRGDYFITIPRVAIHGRIYEIKVKVSQVIINDVGEVKGYPKPGEIERGSIDGEE